MERMLQLDYRDKIELLVKLIKNSAKTVALTGAGVSTESGIPDFRSRDSGLWNKFRPEEVASIDALKRDPDTFYKYNFKWWQGCLQAQPNETHKALAEMEKKGWLFGVITQNIDGLHQRAGSQKVWEVHGHLRSCRCMKCKKEYDMERLAENYWCHHCGGLLRPNVVLFGDPMPEDYYTAEKVMTGCQLLLVIGSSLQVYPVAGLPYLSRQVAIINYDPTPWDDNAQVVFHHSSSEVLAEVVKQLGDSTGPYFVG
ncbi:NAD-dependent deacetylase [Desulfohalotomaculum tongense]|uniref:SIR2 family NAD-dependent protein deacylase n=1 Tax=Desulforadius tongensis TaxID=1216062 RepID=UPI001EE55F32|nr:NAD-dependent deacylase [Desulforadius tongensis]MBM7854818.1 NAD-dependent deacetylase [Desulforadius tongensis]